MNLIQQFADYAATRSGTFQAEDCTACPMADFIKHLYPEATYASAGESSVVFDAPANHMATINFPPRFFSTFVEHAGTWEELTARLRRAS